ncbi:MAG: deoxyribose-phosphate aldolase [Oscillospiraceae bacterium]
MNCNEIFNKIDHTALKTVTSFEEIIKLCDEAIEYNTASVCIPPSYVLRVGRIYGGRLKICTVIGFPLGYQTAEVKAFEAENAIENGADEIDMVINLGDVKNGDFEKVTAEISTVKKVCGAKLLKVIIEACYLTEEEKIRLCQCVTGGGADYIKTSTGFGSAGAKIEDIELFKKYIGKNVRIKAAGGVKTKADLERFLSAGCDRIGTSSAVGILTSGQSTDY